MQALEKIGVLEQDEEKGGRRITQSGQRDLDRKFRSSNLFDHVEKRKLTFGSGIAQTTIEAEEGDDEE